MKTYEQQAQEADDRWSEGERLEHGVWVKSEPVKPATEDGDAQQASPVAA